MFCLPKKAVVFSCIPCILEYKSLSLQDIILTVQKAVDDCNNKLSMFAFIIIILLCVLGFGVSLFVGHWNKSKKSGAEFSVVAFYNKDWRSLFWIFLRVLSYALVTVLLFLMVIATFGEDDAGECFFWIIMFIVGSWFISIPILVIYICSAVQAIRHRDYMNNVFLGLYCFNALLLLCVVILSSQL